MPFKLSRFTSEINKTGFARPAYFMMMITLPTILVREFPEFGKTMQFRVESASLPTRIVLTHDQRYYGPVRRIPYGFTPQDLNFTVILSEDMREREVFMRWQDLVVGNARTRKDGMNQFPIGIFDAGYYKDGVDGASVDLRTYATSPLMQGRSTNRSFFNEVSQIARAVGFDPTVITNPFGLNLSGANDLQIDAAYSVQLQEPFPILVNEIPLSWAEDGYARLNIGMQYRYAKEVNSFKPNPNETWGSGSIADFIRNGIQAFDRFRPVVSLIREQGLGGAIDTIGGQIQASVLNSVRSIFS